MADFSPELSEFIQQHAGKPFALAADYAHWEYMTQLTPLPLYSLNYDGSISAYNHATGTWGPADGYKDNIFTWASTNPEEFQGRHHLLDNAVQQMGVPLPDPSVGYLSGDATERLEAFQPFIEKGLNVGRLDIPLGDEQPRDRQTGTRPRAQGSHEPPAHLSLYVWGGSLVLGGFLKAISHSRIAEKVHGALEGVGNALQKVGHFIGTASVIEYAFSALRQRDPSPEYHSMVDEFIGKAYTLAHSAVARILPGQQQTNQTER